MKVICITGKAGHGKDTVANYMRSELEHGGRRVLVTHFADLLKFICTKFFHWDGKKDDLGRALLQRVGTDTIRAQSPDYWANFIAGILTMFNDCWDYVLIPDCRFPNEVEVLRHYGFDTVLVRVERPGYKTKLTPEQQEHPSETALDDYKYDYRIVNISGLDELRESSRFLCKMVTR